MSESAPHGEAPGRSGGTIGAAELGGALLLGIVVVGAHVLLAPRIAGLDAFYHIGHAAHYLWNGVTDTAFPWATQSVIEERGADLWWGFHVVLLPFAWLPDPAVAIRAAGVALTIGMAATLVWLFRRHGVAHPAVWAALFLVAVPNVLFRFVMVRPHMVSLPAALALVSFLVRGRAWQVGAAATVLAWAHLGLFWMAPGLVVAWGLAPLLAGRGAGDPGDAGQAGGAGGPSFLAGFAAVMLGTALGALLRPHPIQAMALARIQIVQLFAEKASELPILFAVELDPLPVLELLRTAGAFTLAWVLALVVAVLSIRGRAPGRLPRPERLLLVTAALVSVVFLALTLLSARRALVEWVVFGFLLLPFAWRRALSGRARTVALVSAGVVLLLHLPWTVHRHRLNAEAVGAPPDVLRGASAWLATRAEAGDVVFHAHWDDFGPLFARNRELRYLGGMDPIFQFARDEGRYWQYFYLSADLVVEYTCDAFPCYEGEALPTDVVVRDVFGSRWVVADPRRNPKLVAFLRESPAFRLDVDTGREHVFEVLPAPGGAR